MSARKDIDKNRLIYTCNCGWLDKGHANPNNPHPHIGAHNLWEQMTSEHYATKDTLNRAPCFRVYYKQSMKRYGMTAAVEHAYLIKKGLPIVRKQQIALRIFLEVSFGFETGIESAPYAGDFIRYRMLDSAPDAWVKIIIPRNFGSDGRIVN